MSKPNFSRGPWTVRLYEDYESFSIMDRFNKQIAAVVDDDNGRANAQLISAAPEMFRYLNNYKEFIERCCLSGASGCSDCPTAGTCDYHAVTQIIERIGTHK